MDDLLTVQDAAKESCVEISAIYNAIYAGKLVYARRSPYLIRRADLENYRKSARVGRPVVNQNTIEEPASDHSDEQSATGTGHDG